MLVGNFDLPQSCEEDVYMYSLLWTTMLNFPVYMPFPDAIKAPVAMR
jgi:hypothetical protein